MKDNKNNSHSSVCGRGWRRELEEKELWLIKPQIFNKKNKQTVLLPTDLVNTICN